MYDHDDVPPALPAREWGRALRCLKALLANPDDTAKAFEIFDAIDGDALERSFQRMLADPVGRRLVAARPALVDRLADRAALAALPAESFGRAYLALLDETGFDPRDLLALRATVEAAEPPAGHEARAPLDPARQWFLERGVLMHDLWHVLTGYGTDELGEATLLPFTWAQVGGRANAILVMGVALRGTRAFGTSFPRYVAQAWRRGRRTPWLSALHYEELLPLPLDAVRRDIGLVPADVAHPSGILRGNWTTGRPPVAARETRVETGPAAR